MRLLLVEDDPQMARFMLRGLRESSYAVDLVADGEAALYQLSICDYDAMILDVMIPQRDGLEVCRALRTGGWRLPVLMLTARDSVEDRIAGLDTGADDYLIKPFAFGELLARLRALFRRGTEVRGAQITVADLTVDTMAQQASRGGRRIQLTTKEYALLEYLARNAGRVIGREEIAEHVWDESFNPFSNLIEVYINRLRRKVDEDSSLRLIHTRRGAGYMLSEPDGEAVTASDVIEREMTTGEASRQQ